MRSLAAIQDDIRLRTANCVETSRKGKGLLGIFNASRASVEPGCEAKARAALSGELAAAEAKEAEINDSINNAFFQEINGTNKNLYLGLGLGAVVLIILLIILS